MLEKGKKETKSEAVGSPVNTTDLPADVHACPSLKVNRNNWQPPAQRSPSELPRVTTSGASLLLLMLLLLPRAAAAAPPPPLLPPAVAGAGTSGGAVLRTNTLYVDSMRYMRFEQTAAGQRMQTRRFVS